MYSAFMKYTQGSQDINIKAESPKLTNEDIKSRHLYLSVFKLTSDHHSLCSSSQSELKEEKKEKKKEERYIQSYQD